MAGGYYSYTLYRQQSVPLQNLYCNHSTRAIVWMMRMNGYGENIRENLGSIFISPIMLQHMQ